MRKYFLLCGAFRNDELSKGYTSRLAANFGLSSEFGLHGRLSLQVELNYAGQGGQRKGMQPITNLPDQLEALVPPGSYLYANFKNKASPSMPRQT